MLTTDTYAGYQLSTAEAVFTEEEPASAEVYYATTTTVRTDEGRETVEGYRALPENWADSIYWTFDALSNLVEFGGLTDEQIAGIDAGLAELQAQCYDAYDELQAAAEACTQISSDTAAAVHAAAVELVNSILQ